MVIPLRFRSDLKFDEVVKSPKFALYVIPAKAGIYSFQMVMDSGVRRNDDMKTFYDFIKFEKGYFRMGNSLIAGCIATFYDTIMIA